MKHNRDNHGGDWLDNLDAIIAGDIPASREDEELLHVATRLASALTPLREMARTNASSGSHMTSSMQSSQSRMRLPALQTLSRVRPLVAALLLLVCITSIISTIGLANFWHGANQALQATTSLNQINGISIASLAPPHAGLKPLPLLPTTLPSNMQASLYGVLTDASNPDIMTTFVADYRINGQDLQLFEQPSDVTFLATTAQTVQIGTREGQLFQDDAGNHALQWYQNNMMCQLTSKLPTTLLIEIAGVFQPIKSWDLLR